MIQDPNVVRYVNETIEPLLVRIRLLESKVKMLTERAESHLKGQNELLDHEKKRRCDHEWFSSAAYKGAKYCPKCSSYQ